MKKLKITRSKLINNIYPLFITGLAFVLFLVFILPLSRINATIVEVVVTPNGIEKTEKIVGINPPLFALLMHTPLVWLFSALFLCANFALLIDAVIIFNPRANLNQFTTKHICLTCLLLLSVVVFIIMTVYTVKTGPQYYPSQYIYK